MDLIFDNPQASPDGFTFDSVSYSAGGTPFTGLSINEKSRNKSYISGAYQDPSGITNNDTWTNPVSIELVQDVTLGTLKLELNGLFTYTPPPGYIGYVSFKYRLWEAGTPSNVGTVTIRVEGGFTGLSNGQNQSITGMVSALSAGYIGASHRDKKRIISAPSILITAAQVNFTGFSIGDNSPGISRASILSAGYGGHAKGIFLTPASYRAKLSQGYTGQGKNSRYPILSFASILISGNKLPFTGLSVPDLIPSLANPARLSLGFLGRANAAAPSQTLYRANISLGYQATAKGSLYPVFITNNDLKFKPGNTNIFHADIRGVIWRYRTVDIIDMLEKTLDEDLRFDFDFSDHPAISQRGAMLEAVKEIIISPVTALPLTKSTPLVSGNRVQVQLSQGENKTLYKLTCRAVTDQGDNVTSHGRLYVADPD